MKVLLLHPEDSPDKGPWSHVRWDLIVDLGFASSYAYKEWSSRSGAKVFSIHQFAGESESFRWVDKVLDQGRNRLLDGTGLDWWEILSVWSYHDLQTFFLLNQVRAQMDLDGFQVAASRRHLFTLLFESVTGKSIQYLRESSGGFEKAARTLRNARKLTRAQIAEIALDKWDSNYRLRRLFSRGGRVRLTEDAVLLPSSYTNVTRTVLAYARQLPQRRFLLVTTRKSALPAGLPENVTVASLSSYASPSRVTQAETEELLRAWRLFSRSMLAESQEFRHAANAGFWQRFPAHIENGLRLRQAWKNLMESEPVKGVLCGDDLNYYTRLPLMLARRNGLNAVYCSHGALDGGFLFKVPAADVHLVKGEMEKDYLLRARGMEPQQVQIAAPSNLPLSEATNRTGDLIFFSQPYEVDGGRAEAIYSELLPRLHSVAQSTGRKLVLKLHPFESLRSRSALAASILGEPVEVVSGVPPEKIMERAWCGIAIDSSVAVECSLQGIPFFLCGWLDFMGLGYLRQFARFGAGQVLERPTEIERIPQMVAERASIPPDPARLWGPEKPALLEQLLFGNRAVSRPTPLIAS